MVRSPRTGRVLPDFPWDRLAEHKATAGAHPDGIVDLSVGSPVDPTPSVVQQALLEAADAPTYPLTHGTAALRQAAADWLARRHGVGVDPMDVLPTIGGKELVAWLPTLLGLGPGDLVVHPAVAYPTYDIGARLAGATPVAAEGLLELGPQRPKIIWVNSPANPTGRVLPVEHLRKVVAWARERGAVVVSDECYLELGWETRPVSLLHPDVCDGDHRDLLSLHSLSKRSNLAGYRAAFLTGDPVLVGRLLDIRKHAGMIVPAPVQAAMVAALTDDDHVDEQRERYHRRRAALRTALVGAGFRIDHSEAGLYLWATRDEPCWTTTSWFAERGVLVAPGDFYGPGGAQHVRVALTATDERISAAEARLSLP